MSDDNKLLVERLREAIERDGIWGQCTICGGVLGLKCSEMEKCADWTKKLADEIERDYIPRKEAEDEKREIIEAQKDSAHHIMKLYAEKADMPMEDGESIGKWLDRWYIPRPRFEDGEPIQFGENHGNGKEWLYAVKFYQTGEFSLIGSAAEEVRLKRDERIKRPAPEVLDADGVPIKKGDVVYRITDGFMMTVTDTYHSDSCGGCFRSEDSCVGMVASKFTHTKPVLDADGVPIKVGETVWSIDSDTEYSAKVTRVFNNSIDVLWEDGERGENLKGEWFTHREPDSVNRLLDDMKSYSSEHFMPDSDTKKAINGWIERIAELKLAETA